MSILFHHAPLNKSREDKHAVQPHLMPHLVTQSSGAVLFTESLHTPVYSRGSEKYPPCEGKIVLIQRFASKLSVSLQPPPLLLLHTILHISV